MVELEDLIKSGTYFGHRKDRWNPKMAPFLLGLKGGIHLINPNKTMECLKRAADFLKKTSIEGGKVLFVGCKRQAQGLIEEIAKKSGSFYVNYRWLGGTLTNMVTIRKSIARMKWIDQLEASGTMERLPKKEAAKLRRENAKLHRSLDGIKDMERLPAAIVIVDVVKEEIAVSEARKLDIPIVAIVDTNGNPEKIDYPIPANDDSIRSIRTILEEIGNAIMEGKKEGGFSLPAENAGNMASDVTLLSTN